MILTSLEVTAEELERRTGWELNDRGACKGEVCIPIPPGIRRDGIIDVALLAERLQMPIVHDEKRRLWSLGPEAGARALTSAVAPPLVLPDLKGERFEIRSLRGQKVLLVAWASW